MCLDTITKRKEIKDGFGWKVFSVNSSSELVGQWWGDDSRPINKWIHEKNYRWHSETEISCALKGENYYPTGWHIFQSKREARAWEYMMGGGEILRVQYRKATARGIQVVLGEALRCIVAKEMKILSQRRRWRNE